MNKRSITGVPHIVVFGVGRSGTKAVQLYSSYVLAKKYGKVWMNYEPYYWRGRLVNGICYEGLWCHKHVDLFTRPPIESNRRHVKFLSKLSRKEYPTVTKFIRGNGRIGLICEILNPQLAILVIRNLKGILRSCLMNGYRLYSYDFMGASEWTRIQQEARAKFPELDWRLIERSGSDHIHKTAFYWYIMNYSALVQDTTCNLHVVQQEDLNAVYDLVASIEGVDRLPGLPSDAFVGRSLHDETVLIDLSRQPGHKQVLDATEKVMFKLRLPGMPYMAGRKIGQLNAITDVQSWETESRHQASVEIRIGESELFDYYQMKIDGLIADRKRRDEVSSTTGDM